MKVGQLQRQIKIQKIQIQMKVGQVQRQIQIQINTDPNEG